VSDKLSSLEIRRLKFDALKVKYDDQVALLRFLTTFDFQIFSGFLTIQLAFVSWWSTHAIKVAELRFSLYHYQIHWLPWQTAIAVKAGLLIVDGLLGFVAARLLHTNKLRRTSVVGIVRNLNDALRFNEAGVYLVDKPINVAHVYRPWAYWYMFVIFTSYIGVILVMTAT
jgi:hypothetical protein